MVTSRLPAADLVGPVTSGPRTSSTTLAHGDDARVGVHTVAGKRGEFAPAQGAEHGRRLRFVLDDEARQALADRLLRLPTPELVDVLYRVLPARTSSRYDRTTSLVLAEVNRQTDGLDDPKDLLISAVAWPDRDYYDGGFGPEAELWEDGSCPRCGIEVTSTARRAVCPVCGTVCSLT